MLLATAILAFVWMGWELIWSDHGYRVYQGERAKLEKLELELKALKAKREWLAKEILRFRNDPTALEELVHRELGYVHPDEYMLIIPDKREEEGERSEERGVRSKERGVRSKE